MIAIVGYFALADYVTGREKHYYWGYARVFRKSGSWRKWHSDAILVKGTRWRDYILVALVESESGESIIRQVLPAVEELFVPQDFAGNMNEEALPQPVARRPR